MVHSKQLKASQKPDWLTELFLTKAREAAEAGRDNQYWLGCADICRRLDADQPVGRRRRRTASRNRRMAV
jgi:hypothetical protein